MGTVWLFVMDVELCLKFLILAMELDWSVVVHCACTVTAIGERVMAMAPAICCCASTSSTSIRQRQYYTASIIAPFYVPLNAIDPLPTTSGVA